MKLKLLIANPKRIMLTLALVLFTAGGVFAQSQEVRLSSRQLTGEEIFDQIEQQVGLKTAYDKTVFDASQTITLSNTNTDVKGILDQMFAGKNVKYTLRGNRIILTVRHSTGPRRTVAAQTATTDRDYTTNVPGTPVPPIEYRPVAARHSPDSVTVEVLTTRSFPASYSAYNPADAYTQSYRSLPVFALKTNLLYAAALTPNLGLEFGAGLKSTIGLSGGYTWYGHKKERVEDEKEFMHMTLSADYKYWFCERFNGHALGGNLIYGRYNIGGYDIPLLFDKENRYDGHAYGVGINYTYQWAFAKRWGLEFTAGVGYMHLTYDQFECRTCDYNGVAKTKNYFGPTKLGVNLVFLIK